uniref:Uncharacterized protein n=1 Tax=Myoviridae sp. ctCo31 TaxID=2825053 RepID=A0A8S5UMQ6_9CAUD|nr:MAG TPA: hypothetical protein [Myoviridae sp. ctCo31]
MSVIYHLSTLFLSKSTRYLIEVKKCIFAIIIRIKFCRLG